VVDLEPSEGTSEGGLQEGAPLGDSCPARYLVLRTLTAPFIHSEPAWMHRAKLQLMSRSFHSALVTGTDSVAVDCANASTFWEDRTNRNLPVLALPDEGAITDMSSSTTDQLVVHRASLPARSEALRSARSPCNCFAAAERSPSHLAL
jgi:hypothetical protein